MTRYPVDTAKQGSGQVTVAVPTFNRARLLGITLATLVSQTEPCQIIVSDDASSDNTPEICAAFSPRVRYSRNERRLGLFANWNRAIELVDTELVAIFHDDDLYDAGIVSAEADLLRRHPNLVMVHTGCRFIDDDNRPLHSLVKKWPKVMSGKAFRHALAGRLSCPVAAPSVMLRTNAIRAIGGFDESLKMAGDLEAWVALSEIGDIGFVPRPLVAVRRRGRHANEHGVFSWSTVDETLAVSAATRAKVRGQVGPFFQLKADCYLAKFLLREIIEPSGGDPVPVAKAHGSRFAVLGARAVPFLYPMRPFLELIRPLGRQMFGAAGRLIERYGATHQILLSRWTNRSAASSSNARGGTHC
jgi:hypothetical protein